MLSHLQRLVLALLFSLSLVCAAPAAKTPAPASITVYSKPACAGESQVIAFGSLYNKSQKTSFPAGSFKLPSALRPNDQLDISTSPNLAFSSAATNGKTGADFTATACDEFKTYYQAGADNGKSRAVGPGQCVDVKDGFSCVRIWDTGAKYWPDLPGKY